MQVLVNEGSASEETDEDERMCVQYFKTGATVNLIELELYVIAGKACSVPLALLKWNNAPMSSFNSLNVWHEVVSKHAYILTFSTKLHLL